MGICSTYARLINSCSSCLEMYALSRHKCCNLFLLLPDLGLYDEDIDFDFGLLMTVSSATSVTRLMSWVLAAYIYDRQWNIFFICQNVSFCLQYAPVCGGIISCFRPLKVTSYIDILSMDCQLQLIPISLS
jgi:hypothetical protein